MAAGDQTRPTDSDHSSLGLGAVGVGRFGQYCLEQYLQTGDLRPVALFDPDPTRTAVVAGQLGFAAASNLAELLARADVDIVYVASPPATHVEVALQALRAGKHVLCEKPLATNLDVARTLVRVADERRLVLAANLIMRYNPICHAVGRILDERLLGEPLHAFFENYAADEFLPPHHWFWDKQLSGGIFVEHAVHFFDLFSMWFGAGRVTGADQSVRPGSGVVEQVSCSVRFEHDVQASFYHGFHQPARMDRQEIRIVCERGSIRLFEWIPVRLEIDCLADRRTLDLLRAVALDPDVDTIEDYDGAARAVSSRHRQYTVDGRFLLRTREPRPKMALYAEAVRELMADQVQAIRDPSHPRRITGTNGVTSLELAIQAEAMASAPM